MNIKNSVKHLALKLANIQLNSRVPIVYLCIGSDKIVGDMLGVIVGECLKSQSLTNGFIYGEINNPITQKNIKQTVEMIKNKHPFSKVVVVDSVLGDEEEVGTIKTSNTGVYAGGQFGNGVYVGDYSILGVVGTKGINALSFLANVKIGLIKNMSDTIVEAFALAERFRLAL